MSEPRWVCLNDAAAMQQVDDEMIVLNVERGQYFRLDASATRMLHAALAAESLQAACTALLEVYQADEAALRDDLQHFLQDMHACGIVHLA